MDHYHQQRDSWHYSRLADYQTCPHREALRRAGERQMVTPGMARGTEFHAQSARYCLGCRDAGKPSLPDLAEEIALSCSPDVEPIFRAYAEEMKMPVRADLVYVERPFTFQLADGTPFSGTLDLAYINGSSATVVDYKTHAPRWIDDTTPHEQLRTYGYLLQRAHPDLTDIRGVICAMQPNGVWRTASWPLIEGEDPFGDALEDYGVTLLAKVRRIQADTECKPNPLPGACVECSYGHVCEYHGPRGEAFLQGGPEMWAFAAYWYSARSAQFRDMVQAYVENTGIPVSCPDGREYRFETPEAGWDVTDYQAAVALVREADEVIRTPRQRSTSVARTFKLDQDFLAKSVPVLLADQRFSSRAAGLFVRKKPGRMTFGLRGVSVAEQSEACDAQAAE